MNRFWGKAAVFGVAAAAWVASQSEGCAQSPASQLYRLSSAIEATKRTPFHVPLRAAHSGGARGPHGLRTVPPRTGGRGVVIQETGRDADTDGASAAKVLAASAIAAGLADLAALYVLLDVLYRPSDDALAPLLIVAVPVIVVVGPALGARCAGGDLGNALLGSFFGAVLGAATVPAVHGLPRGVAFSLVAFVQAGATTLFVAGDRW